MADTEVHTWEQVRQDAITAAADAARGCNVSQGSIDGPETIGAVVADAVLAVVDEEALNRLGHKYAEDSRLRSLRAEDGHAVLDMTGAREAVAGWCLAARGMLDGAGAENYTETSMEFRDRPRGERYAFILQRVGKLTPHEARKQAEARADAAVRLLEEAMHLRMNGERAPGGNETWQNWDRRAEVFLRGLQ